MKLRIIHILSWLAAVMLLLASCGDRADSEQEKVLCPIVGDGKSDYVIIVGKDSGSAVKELSLSLADSIEKLCGARLERRTDDTGKYAETEHEIVIGVCGRTGSGDLAATLGGDGWKVSFADGKIFIAARNESLLRNAVESLLEAVVTKDGDFCIEEGLSITGAVPDEAVPLIAGGALKYEIIFQEDCDQATVKAVNGLYDKLKSMLGCSVSIKTDNSVKASDDSYEILIGRTNRPESTELYDSMGYFDVKCAAYGKKIAVGAGMDSNIGAAVDMLSSKLAAAVSGTFSGDVIVIPSDIEGEKLSAAWAEGIPEVSAGKSLGGYAFDDNSTVLCYDGINEADYSFYVTSAKNSGFSFLGEYSLGGNRYTLLEGKNNDLYVSYISSLGMLRVYAEKSGTKYPLAEQQDAPAASGQKLWQLPVDVVGSASNGGMSYVIRLADGTFIVVDGGYATNREADGLYELLMANTADGKQPVISAWFITHLHYDHYGCLKKFTEKYSDKVTVKAFYCNFPTRGYAGLESNTAPTLVSFMKKWKGAQIYDRIHSGMTFCIADAKAEVLFTHEDLYPQRMSDAVVNDTTTVFAITVAGQRILFLGDIETASSDVMTSFLAPAAIKSDIVQFAHHGYEGATVKVYKEAAAPVVLWPAPIYGTLNGAPQAVFESMITTTSYSPSNEYICKADFTKKIIVSGAGLAELDLPYTPSGEKLPDYRSIYLELLKKYN